MPDYNGSLETLAGLTEWSGAATARLQVSGLSTLATTGLGQEDPDLIDDTNLPALGPTLDAGVLVSAPSYTPQPQNTYLGTTNQKLSAGDPWFDKIIVTPQLFTLGNILSAQVKTVDIYNTFKETNQTWTSFTNNAGAGLTFPDLPSLPATLLYQNGFLVTVQISADGPPKIDGTLDFVFNLYTTLVTITGTRIIVFPFVPESPLTERLISLTDVLESRDGSEQRIKLRKNPRQEFDFRLALDEDERRYLDSLLFDWQDSVFGLPIWPEATLLTSAGAINDLTINVQTTDYADYRVGGFVIVITDRDTFDALEIESLTSTSITTTSGLTSAYPINTLVLPMRTAIAPQSITGARALVNLGASTIRFKVLDNDSLLSDVSAWNSLNSKVFLDGPNSVPGGSVNNTLLRRLYNQDGQTGVFSQSSPWARNKRITQKGFVTTSRQQLWELRQLLHNLSGQRTSFYLPTFYDDLKLSADIIMSSSTITIENIGFNQFIQDRKGFIRFLFTDGTSLTKALDSSVEVDSDTETLTFTTTWAQGYTIAEVSRIEYVETMRSASDTIEIKHANGSGYAGVVMPVKEVFSE